MNRFFILLFFFLPLIGFAQEQERVMPTATYCPIVEKVADKVYSTNCPSAPVNEKGAEVYTVVQEMPEFPGGAGEMMKFIQKNFHYPEIEKEAYITGKCFIKFIVEPDGSISNVQVLKGIFNEPDCNKEAVRVVESMPKWSAGKQNGKPVRVYFNIPISIHFQ